VKVGDLVRDMYTKSLGVGCLIEVIASHRDWDGASVCKVYWSMASPYISRICLRRTAYLKVINESR